MLSAEIKIALVSIDMLIVDLRVQQRDLNSEIETLQAELDVLLAQSSIPAIDKHIDKLILLKKQISMVHDRLKNIQSSLNSLLKSNQQSSSSSFIDAAYLSFGKKLWPFQ